jgi:ferredoxin, 2Fe-2S
MKIRFIEPGGALQILDGSVDQSLMELAKASGINGIEAECGGSMVCGTCHVHVAENWVDRLEAPSDMEADMLEFVLHPDNCARLSCQIRLDERYDGLEVSVPPAQR